MKNATVARREYDKLLRDLSKLTRTQPAFVQPCEPLMAIIQGVEANQPMLVKDWSELAMIQPSATHRLEIKPENGNGWIKPIDEPIGTDSYTGIYLYNACVLHALHLGQKLLDTAQAASQECGFNVQLANWDADTQPLADELP